MNMTASRLYLSALGIINALGSNKKQVLENLLSGSQQGIAFTDQYLPGRIIPVAVVNDELPSIPDEMTQYNSRNNRLLQAAYQQIENEVRALIQKVGANRVGVVLGTSTSGIDEATKALEYKNQYGNYPEKYHYALQEMGNPAEFLAAYLQLENVAFTISTACSSSSKALSSARNLIECGLCDAVLVGGVDTLCKLTINGFSSLESVSEKICNPFSKNRNGITIGEAAALFILSKEKSAIQLLGLGESSDAYHISAPIPDGSGAKMAIRAALNDAEVKPSEIDYINLHGTATIKNDEVESQIVYSLFGDKIPCSSTKALTGHTLGAAGATEAGLCWLLLSEYNTMQQLPPNIWDQQQDPGLPSINLISSKQSYSRNKKRNIILSNSFAFGGSNACVILGAETHESTNFTAL